LDPNFVKIIDKPWSERLQRMNRFCAEVAEVEMRVGRCMLAARQSQLLEEVGHHLDSLRTAAGLLASAIASLEDVTKAQKE
jgi:hypothetical protein